MQSLNSGLEHQRHGRLREALAQFSLVLKVFPRHVQALHHAGLALWDLGDRAAGIRRVHEALVVEPDDGARWSVLAGMYETLDRPADAVVALHEALRRSPADSVLWSSLAAQYLRLARDDEAEACARRALQVDEGNRAAWFNLALALQQRGYLEAAVDATERARALADDAAATGLLAQLRQSLGDFEAARTLLDAGIARHPDSAPLHFQAAALADRSGALAAAAVLWERALALAPGDGAALSELLFLRKRLCDWTNLGALRERFRQGVARGQSGLTPFSLLSDPSSRALQRQAAAAWSARYERTGPLAGSRPPSSRRLRIGYLSADFHEHATSVLASGLFERHDRSRFEVLGYSTGPDDGSALARRVRAAFDRFQDAQAMSDDALARRIAGDEVDVLVDLKGHTANARTGVLARRPAPVQAHYLGYPGTLGASFVDYLVGDATVTPLEHAADYRETLVLLPASYQVNDRRPEPRIVSRADTGLPPSAFVFCCFNSAYKIGPEAFTAWMHALHAVPGSVLWLLARKADDAMVANLRREAATRGIAGDRLLFATHRPLDEYLGLYAHADLFLDTWPYNAHTTASDALWAGCPVLTMLGETFAGRVGASVLRAAGLAELVTPSVDAYGRLAVELAGDAGRRARLRAYLAREVRASALFDTAATTRALEAAYLAMHAQHRSGARAPIVLG